MGTMVDCEGPGLGFTSQTSSADVHNEVGSRSQGIFSKLDSLEQAAQLLRLNARSALSAAAQTLTETIPNAELNVALSQYNTVALTLPSLPQLASVDVRDNSSLRGDFSFSPSPLARSNIVAPAVGTLDFPEAPSVGSAVAAPSPIDLSALPDVPPAPSVTFEIASLPSIEGLPTLSLTPVTVDWGAYLPPSTFDVSVAGLSADRVSGAAASVFEPAPYLYKVLPDALFAAADILAGDMGYDTADAHAAAHTNLQQALGAHAQRVQTVWSRRGFVRNDADVRATYAVRVAGRVTTELDTYQRALVARQRMQRLPRVLQTVIEGHAAIVELKRQMYDAEFALLTAEREAQMQMLSAFAEQVRGKVLEYSLVSAQYAQQIARIKAEVDAHLAQVQVEIAKGEANSARASAYAASQEAASASVRAYEARYRAAVAVVEAYNAMMQALQTRARLAGAELARFEAESEAWGAQLAAAQAEYNVRAAENQAIVAHNRALAARVSTEGLKADAIAAEASIAAADVAAQVAQLRATLATRLGDYLQVERQNALAAAQASKVALMNRAQAVTHSAATLPQRAQYSALASSNDAAVSVAAGVANVAISTARELQNNRIQLANAYANLYKALADAEAASTAGELSNIRADVRLTARGDVSHTAQVSERYENSRSASVNKSNDCVTVYRPMTY